MDRQVILPACVPRQNDAPEAPHTKTPSWGMRIVWGLSEGILRFSACVALTAFCVIIAGIAAFVEPDFFSDGLFAIPAVVITSSLTFGLFVGLPMGCVLSLLFLIPMWSVPLARQAQACVLATVFVNVPYALMDVSGEILNVLLVAPVLCVAQAVLYACVGIARDAAQRA